MFLANVIIFNQYLRLYSQFNRRRRNAIRQGYRWKILDLRYETFQLEISMPNQRWFKNLHLNGKYYGKFMVFDHFSENLDCKTSFYVIFDTKKRGALSPLSLKNINKFVIDSFMGYVRNINFQIFLNIFNVVLQLLL